MNIFDAARAYAERTIEIAGQDHNDGFPEASLLPKAQGPIKPIVGFEGYHTKVNDDPWVGRANLDDDPPFS